MEIHEVKRGMAVRPIEAFCNYKADELYLAFDPWRVKVLGSFQSEIAADQLFCLDSIQQVFVKMGRECWTEDGVNNSAEWKHIRHLSAKTLEVFGWSR